ncbi:hypothetical protein DL98DRAFT_652098 [Cadophora sp. DSE1049]|nr:hypothetical protein DL98DRAFT_652098 [Cadophora sp. DSE1049]
MDCNFFDDLFLNQEDFAGLTPLSGAPADVNDFDDIWNQNNHEDPTKIQGGAGDFSSYWDQFMVGHEFEFPINESRRIEQQATTGALFHLPRLPASEVELDFNSLPLSWAHEFHQDSTNSSFPAYFAVSAFDESPLQTLGQSEASPTILTPTTSSASSESGIRVFDHSSKPEMPCNSVFPAIEDVESRWPNSGQPHHQDQQLTATFDTHTYSSLKNTMAVIAEMRVESVFLGSQRTLPPPEHLMTAFESQPPKNAKRGKKAYNTKQRKKVSEVRNKRACWQCQIRKTACSTEETCTRCQGMTQDAKLAGHICLRQKLLDVYLSHSSIYEMIIKSQERNRASIRFIPYATEQILFKMEDMIEASPSLTLTVTKYERIYPGSGLSGSYTRPVSWHPPSTEQRALLPTAVPGIEQLESMSRASLSKVHDPFLNHELHDKVNHVLLLCSERPLQHSTLDLVAATLSIVKLRSFLMHSLVFSHVRTADHAPEEDSYADPVLNQHIRAIALTGIAKAERFVLARFNDLHRLLSLDKDSMMIAQICLLRLMLVYRNDVLLCERSVEIPVKSRVIFTARLEKVRFMYRMVATTYGTLCDKTSSFGQFSSPEDISDNDWVLANAFEEMEIAFTYFCEHDLNNEQDEMLLYFIERRAKRKERKAQS